ncbi:MAG: DUF2304 family protein [Methylococcaceae bacterium]|jgi:hypothetical protein|nr:DUF2304 family protein [Methylococcaceae bacterium]
MPFRQQVFALLICVVVFLVIIDLVRRRKLHEEFSVLWLTTSIVMFVLVLKYDWLLAFTLWVGAGFPTSILFIGALVFLALVAVQFSIKISQLADQVKNLSQDNALLRFQVETLAQQGKGISGQVEHEEGN